MLDAKKTYESISVYDRHLRTSHKDGFITC
jgi:hypothetical protein